MNPLRTTIFWAARLPAVVLTAPVVLYRVLISPLVGPRCKYHPSCSRYALDALRDHGAIRGSVLAGWRLVRCNPWSHGGYDPVSAQRLFHVKRPDGDAGATESR